MVEPTHVKWKAEVACVGITFPHMRGGEGFCMLAAEESMLLTNAFVQAMGTVLITASFLPTSVGAAEDSLCPALRTFREARLLPHQTRVRDWVELRWVGVWLGNAGWHFECQNSGTLSAKHFCDYLTANTSFEFPDYLPIRFLGCSGFTVPSPYPSMYPWIGSIDLGWRNTGPSSAERLPLLEIALGHHKSLHDSVRISVFKGDADEHNSPLPELFPTSDYNTEK